MGRSEFLKLVGERKGDRGIRVATKRRDRTLSINRKTNDTSRRILLE